MRRQQIIETIECDQCGEEVDEPHSFNVEIGRAKIHGGGVPIRRTVDLCPDHARVVVELHELLRRVGRAPVVATKREGTERCEVCGADVPTIYICSHIVKAHGGKAPMPRTCPDCGKECERPTMLAHRKMAHGYDHRAALLASLPKSKPVR